MTAGGIKYPVCLASLGQPSQLCLLLAAGDNLLYPSQTLDNKK